MTAQGRSPSPWQPPHILIPTKNRHHCLKRTCQLALATGAQVTVCDQSIDAWRGIPGVEILHRPDVASLPAARNVLLQHARAPLLIFIDDDTDLASDFAVQLTRLAAQEPACSAWGPVIEVRPRRIQRLMRLGQLGVFRDPRRLTAAPSEKSTRALFGCCFAVRRTMAVTLHGFDCSRRGYSLGEDLDFFKRAHTQGFHMRFSRRLRAYHREESSSRYDPHARGAAKARFWLWLARRHGRKNPATILHLMWIVLAGLSGYGREAGSVTGVIQGLWSPGADRLR
ncbi:MAG: hypothetical protein EA401_02005 [Planctomycetota bacterium]|nr:MAG: hypothetical protein EA401_02005 [Planctomycetota bacterium]